VRTSRRFHLGLPAELEVRLAGFAFQRGLGLGPAIRLLLGEALAGHGARDSVEGSPLTLAALVAAEHAVLMVASILPEGERRMNSLAERATHAAEERMALFRAPAGAEEEA
jgi:hypothetical protein